MSIPQDIPDTHNENTAGNMRWHLQNDILDCVNNVLKEDFCHHEWVIADYLVSQGWEKTKKP